MNVTTIHPLKPTALQGKCVEFYCDHNSSSSSNSPVVVLN
jgi:hypothetical protein